MAAFDDKAAPRRLPVNLMIAASAAILAAAHLLRSRRRNNAPPRGTSDAAQRRRVVGRAATEEERRQQRAAAAEARLGVGGQPAGGASGRGGLSSGTRGDGGEAGAAAAGARGAAITDTARGRTEGVGCSEAAAGGSVVDGRRVAQEHAVGSPGWCGRQLTPYGQALMLKKEIDELEAQVKAWCATHGGSSQSTPPLTSWQAPVAAVVEGAEQNGVGSQSSSTVAGRGPGGDLEREELLSRVSEAAMILASIEPDMSVAPIRREQNTRLSRLNEVLNNANDSH